LEVLGENLFSCPFLLLEAPSSIFKARSVASLHTFIPNLHFPLLCLSLSILMMLGITMGPII
jgi:hypothetical protein